MSKMIGGFSIYPRGFLGTPLGLPTEKTYNPVVDKIATRMHYKIDLFDSPETNGSPLKLKEHGNNKVQVNNLIEYLYNEHVKRDRSNSISFDFRENVLAVILTAFGTENFLYWFQTQLACPATGNIHRHFLDDTLRFITTGRREMSIENWHALVVVPSDVQTNVTKMSPIAATFFYPDGNTAKKPQNTRLIEVVQQWCTQPRGFEDLIGTAHVMFGNIVM